MRESASRNYERLSLSWPGKVIEIIHAAAKPSVPPASKHKNSVLRQRIRRTKFAPLDRQKHDRNVLEKGESVQTEDETAKVWTAHSNTDIVHPNNR